jgi:hypothetical protein
MRILGAFGTFFASFFLQFGKKMKWVAGQSPARDVIF